MSTPRKVVQYVSNNTSAQQPCKPLRAKFIKAKILLRLEQVSISDTKPRLRDFIFMIKCNDKEVLFMSEKMTKNELEQLRKLQAKQQRIRRHEKEFWKEVDNRLDEIMKRYNLIDNDVIDDDIVSPDKLPKF